MSSINQENVEAIKRSLELVGPIQVIVKDQNGRTLSGRHRELADQGWPIRTIEVKDAFHRELIILLSNVQRQITEEELKFRLNRIAMEYWIKTKIWDEKGKKEIQIPEEKVCVALCEMFDPEQGPRIYRTRLIQQVLESRWKEKPAVKQGAKNAPQTTTDTPKKLEIIKKTALDIQNTTSNQDPFPAKDCRCRECPHKTELCGYPP